ncbi:hypothetical protein [Xanthomarina sp. F2636L]|uniref:hypothetical protein n=1 Tax=Xanthomarina sp. F2636L TaxID=2996018 RepID=UPI00225DE296|nr:hypothetical protein [Xanthomarina sp. F2636L]MCX7550657.1 hypothetical protein [Xanthomarina sp. F2636L]
MKNHPFALIVLSMLLLTNLSCDEDDNNNNNNPDEIKLTVENNFYEGDLYRLYLDNQILFTTAEIDIANEILENDPDNVEWLAELEALQNALGILENKVEEQNQYAAVIINVPRVPRVPPIPPQPCLSGACMPNILKYITISEDILSVNVVVRNSQTEEIITSATIDQFTPLPEYNNLVSATSLDFKEFTGSIYISVQRTNKNNETINYNINGNVF